MDVAPGRQVHHGVRAPADRPDHLVHFARHVRSDGGIADVGVDLDQEVAPDGHRFAFRVVDVAGDDRAAARHFLTHPFAGDIVRDAGAPVLPVADQIAHHFAAQVLSRGDIFHFGRDDAAPGIMHLADVHVGLGAQRAGDRVRESGHAAGTIRAQLAIVFRLDRAALVFLDIAARHDPFAAQLGQALGNVDLGGGIGVGTAGVIDPHRRFAAARLQLDFAHGDAQRADVDLLRSPDRPGGYTDFKLGIDVGHDALLLGNERRSA